MTAASTKDQLLETAGNFVLCASKTVKAVAIFR
jgi:hypothetical protein